jgi:hypothetical protein
MLKSRAFHTRPTQALPAETATVYGAGETAPEMQYRAAPWALTVGAKVPLKEPKSR